MNYVEQNLMPNEKLIRHTYGHWVAFVPAAVGSVTALAAWWGLPLILAGAKAGDPLRIAPYARFGAASMKALGVIVVVVAVWFLFSWLKYIASEYAITDHRVLVKHGLVFRRTAELFLERVESVRLNQTVSGRLLGYGTVVVVGIGESREDLHNVPEPLDFRRILQAQTAAIRDAMRTAAVPASAVAAEG